MPRSIFGGIMEDESVEIQSATLSERLLGNRWVWLALSVVLLVSSALTVYASIQQAAHAKSEISAAQSKLAHNKDLVERADEISASHDECVQVVSTRLQQLEALKGSLSIIGTEYRNMFHSGIGNVNVDSYVDALNSVVAITGVLDAQNEGACDAK